MCVASSRVAHFCLSYTNAPLPPNESSYHLGVTHGVHIEITITIFGYDICGRKYTSSRTDQHVLTLVSGSYGSSLVFLQLSHKGTISWDPIRRQKQVIRETLCQPLLCQLDVWGPNDWALPYIEGSPFGKEVTWAIREESDARWMIWEHLSALCKHNSSRVRGTMRGHDVGKGEREEKLCKWGAADPPKLC